MATTRIKNLDNLGVEIGQLEFLVPQVVINELKIMKKTAQLAATFNLIQNFKTIPIPGKFADSKLVDYVKANHCIVATLDRQLKKQIKINGGSVLSFSGDRIVLEQ